MADFTHELMVWLADQLSLTIGTSIFTDHYPDADHDDYAIMFVRDTGGPAGPIHDAWKQRTVQIVARAPVGRYHLGRELIEDARDLLKGTSNWLLPGFRVDWSDIISEPYPLGRDEKYREEFTMNIIFNLAVRRSW